MRAVIADCYVDRATKDYGEPFVDGKPVPYDPEHHAFYHRVQEIIRDTSDMPEDSISDSICSTSLIGLSGVENVITDCRTRKVVVKGEKADPVKVFERVQRKSHRQPPEKEEVKVEEKKEEPYVITVVLGVYMHCDACAQRILRMKGKCIPQDFASNYERSGRTAIPRRLRVQKTGKHAAVVKVEPKKKEEEKLKEEKSCDTAEKAERRRTGKRKRKKAAEEVLEEDLKMELRKNEMYPFYYPHKIISTRFTSRDKCTR
ncbi:hypothetical protein OROMI_011573 [Orobanche minor]